MKRLIRRAGPQGLAESDFDRLFYRTNFGARVCRLRLRPIDGDAFLWGLDELAPRQRNTNLRLLQVLVQLGEVQTSRCPERGVVYRLVAQA